MVGRGQEQKTVVQKRMMRAKIYKNGDIVLFTNNAKPQRPTPGEPGRRKFVMKYSDYRKLASIAADMFEKRKNKIIFVTLTMQTNEKCLQKTNPVLQRFIRRLRDAYGLQSYFWVAERQKRGAIHYHCLFDVPYVRFSELSVIWSKFLERSGLHAGEKNSVSGSKSGSSVVENYDKAVRYMTKYLTKQRKEPEKHVFYTRNYAYSKNLSGKPYEISEELAEELRTYAKKEYRHKYGRVYLLPADIMITKHLAERLRRDIEIQAAINNDRLQRVATKIRQQQQKKLRELYLLTGRYSSDNLIYVPGKKDRGQRQRIKILLNLPGETETNLSNLWQEKNQTFEALLKQPPTSPVPSWWPGLHIK